MVSLFPSMKHFKTHEWVKFIQIQGEVMYVFFPLSSLTIRKPTVINISKKKIVNQHLELSTVQNFSFYMWTDSVFDIHN